MKSLSKTRFTAYLGGIFLAGVICGSFLPPSAKPWSRWGAATPGTFAEQIENHIRNELRLTDAQLLKLRPIILRNVEAIQTYHCQAMQKVEEYMEQSRPQFVAELDPAQLKRFEEMEAERKAFLQKRWGKSAPTNSASANASH